MGRRRGTASDRYDQRMHKGNERVTRARSLQEARAQIGELAQLPTCERRP